MFKKVIRHLLMGRRVFQPLWERLNSLSLLGMNIGCGDGVNSSGELWIIDHFGKRLPDNKPVIVFDAGANIGHYASAVISRFGDKAKVYCFEPSKSTFQMLAKNLSKYENAVLYNFGFGDKEERVILYSNTEGSGLSSVYNRQLNHRGISMSHTEEIGLKTLDGFCTDNGIKHINLLKLDVEGHELEVLKGAENLVSSNSIDLIQFEFGGCNIDSRTYFQDFFYLLNPCYRIHRILKDGITPIEVYKETYEVFTTTNYLAISRKVQFR